MNLREIYKEALKDPSFKIDAVLPSQYGNIEKMLGKIAEDEYISEWKHTAGEISYEYHIHQQETGHILQNLLEQGMRGGNPRLTKVYSKKDLIDLVQGALMV